MKMSSGQIREFTYPETLWAGTEHSLALAVEVHNLIMAGIFDSPSAAAAQEDKPYNYDLQGSVGIIAINGSLVNTDSPYNQYRGITSYADVRRAVVYAANDPAAKAILLSINSGGGAVSGVADAGNLISSVDKALKPIYAHTDGVMASAAYWLGSSARAVYASNTSIVGSIGVIATHTEYSKLLKEAGIGVTVMRAGEYKALANSMEPLTEVAKRQMQDQLNAAYGVFIGHVAEHRGTSVALADSKMGQGREFFGVDAVTAGLADGVKTFDEMVGLINQKVLDTSGNKANNPQNFQRGHEMPRQALTEVQIAALAAGAGSLEAVVETVTEVVAEVPPVAEAVTEVKPAADVKPAENPGVIEYLQGQLAAAAAANTALSVEVAGLKDKLTGLEASQAGLVQIAVKSLSHMKVAMGRTVLDATGMSAVEVLAEHASTSTAFAKAFPIGGVAAVNVEDPKTVAAVPDSVRQARLNATRFGSR